MTEKIEVNLRYELDPAAGALVAPFGAIVAVGYSSANFWQMALALLTGMTGQARQLVAMGRASGRRMVACLNPQAPRIARSRAGRRLGTNGGQESWLGLRSSGSR